MRERRPVPSDQLVPSEVPGVYLPQPICQQHLHGPVKQEHAKLSLQSWLPLPGRPIADPLDLVCHTGET